MNASYRNPYHLYRALLREATYLFHPKLQLFHATYIKWHFRRSQYNCESPLNGSIKLPSQREAQQWSRGKKYLLMLSRANSGYQVALSNVLKMAYGRKGKRRRELLSQITMNRTKTTASGTTIPLHLSDGWKPTPQFSALVTSQKKLQSYLDVGGKLSPPPTIPKVNRWQKPFPKCRVKKIQEKWYAKTAATLMPPLEEAEWIDIYKLASTDGVCRLKPVPRRSQAVVPVFSPVASKHLETAVEVSRVAKSSSQRLDPTLSNGVRAQLGNAHRLTPRYLRRIVSRSVLQNTATPLADPESGRLAFRWEFGSKIQLSSKQPTRSQALALFS